MNLEEAFKIRYVKLYFTAQFPGTSIMPRDKASALRGGMGEMLLRSNCVRDRLCEACDFENECIVRRTMYSKFDKKPAFMTTGESVGYVLECEDQREVFEKGDTLTFQLIIFGKTIVYFSQFLQAFYALGMRGIGKEKATFRIVSIENSDHVPLLVHGGIMMQAYEIKYITDYVNERLSQLDERLKGRTVLRLQFESPLSLKFRGEMLEDYQAEALLMAVKRRLYMLGCFENLDCEAYYRAPFHVPVIKNQEHYPVSVKRVSFRKNEKLVLRGIKGHVVLQDVDREDLCLLLAGELIHVGKSTSFGFGRYRVVPV